MASAESVAAVVAAGGVHVPELMDRVEERLLVVAESHGPVLGEHARATIAAGGKRLRPLLVLVAAGPEPSDPDSLVRAAVAVELVHAASLVHDDVLDAAALRRGRPTVVAAGGREIAVATGDLLFSRAFAELAATRRVDAVRVLSDAASALAEGELLQRADAWDVTVPRERYLARCDLKTGRLFQAACALGALLGGGSADALGAFGRRTGLAFQLLDDVLDVSGPAERTGKHRGTDLLDGTVTLPLILARERDPEIAAVDLRTVRTPEQAEALCDAIAATGALDVARADALELVAEAKRLLPALPEAQQAALELVADGVVDRYAYPRPRSLRAGSGRQTARRRSARSRPPCWPA
jgi:geranylgeranyl pyrophosphate synthase